MLIYHVGVHANLGKGVLLERLAAAPLPPMNCLTSYYEKHGETYSSCAHRKGFEWLRGERLKYEGVARLVGGRSRDGRVQ